MKRTVGTIIMGLLFASVVHAEPYSETLQRDSGLEAGKRYVPVDKSNDNDECLSGRVSFTEVNPTAAAILIGGRPLIEGVGPGASETDPLDQLECKGLSAKVCYTKRASEPIQRGRIEATKVMRRPQGKFNWHYLIELTEGGLNYTVTFEKKKLRCQLVEDKG